MTAPLKRSDIDDDHVVELARQAHAHPFSAGVVQRLMAEGVPEKLALAKVEHLVRKGRLDYGVSPNTAWPTS